MEILNDNDIIIKDDDGKETLMKILFSYDNEERNATYVFVYEPNNEDDIYCFKVNEDTNELIMVEDEDELEEASEVLEAYDNDEKINEIK